MVGAGASCREERVCLGPFVESLARLGLKLPTVQSVLSICRNAGDRCTGRLRRGLLVLLAAQ